MKCINNVKISALFYSVLPFSNFIEIAQNRKIPYSQKRNILIIKDIFSLSVFKKIENKFHINITGIPSLKDVTSTIDWLVNTYCKDIFFRMISFQIDNITATFDIGFNVSLEEIASNVKKSKYNPERFPGLCYKTLHGTAVIFDTGKINIVGCKSEYEIFALWKDIQEIIYVVRNKKIS